MKIYKSKISYGFLITIFLIFAIIDYFHIQSNNATFWSVIMVVFFHFVALLFLAHLFFNTNYIIENKVLKIKCGFIYKKEIQIEDVISIAKTNSLLSSPAASLTERIVLVVKTNKPVIISPKKKNQFIEDLLSINPDIKINNI